MNDSLVTRRTTCRLCASPQVLLVLPIKPSPIADAFVSQDRKHLKQPLIPLDLYQCQECGHVQNLDVVNPDLLFRDYIFYTSSSVGLIKHFYQYAKDVVEKLAIEANSLVVEIGSNDGTLLKNFKDLGLRVQGIDPALEVARHANAAGLPTLPEFFTSVLAKKIGEEQGLAKLIVANNVYAHSDHLADMTDGIEQLLAEDGVFVFEASYLLDIIDKFLFDTVYHEHLSYHSIASLQHFFKLHGLHFYDVEKTNSKGGSLRGFVQKIGAARKETPIISEMIKEEQRRGLHQPAIFKDYERKIQAQKEALQLYVEKAIKDKKRIVAYGASTTVITLMYHFELESKLEYLVDDNEKKHGMFSPGAHLEVKPSSILYTDKPDIVLVLAWQYADPIMTKHQVFLEQGGTFVVPLPSLREIKQLKKMTA